MIIGYSGFLQDTIYHTIANVGFWKLGGYQNT
jgi:hypothetical protein